MSSIVNTHDKDPLAVYSRACAQTKAPPAKKVGIVWVLNLLGCAGEGDHYHGHCYLRCNFTPLIDEPSDFSLPAAHFRVSVVAELQEAGQVEGIVCRGTETPTLTFFGTLW